MTTRPSVHYRYEVHAQGQSFKTNFEDGPTIGATSPGDGYSTVMAVFLDEPNNEFPFPVTIVGSFVIIDTDYPGAER